MLTQFTERAIPFLRHSGRDHALQCTEYTPLAEHIGDGYSVLHKSPVRR